MISTAFIKAICDSFPNGRITIPFEAASYVFDAKGATIGYFDYRRDIFYLLKNYEHWEQARAALQKNSVEIEYKEVDPAELLYLKSVKQE